MAPLVVAKSEVTRLPRRSFGPPRNDVWIAAFVFLLAGCAFRPETKAPQTLLEAIRRQIHGGGSGPLSAGAAKVEITPPVGTPLAGYSKRHGKPSVGIRDPLYVRTLALSDGEDSVLLISADLLVFPNSLEERILRQIHEEQKIPRQAVVLTATHTHSGSGSIAPGFLYEKVFGRYDRSIEESIAARVSWSVRQALENRKPVHWGVAQDQRFLEGFVENRAMAGGPADPSLAVLFFGTAEGEPKAIVVNAAAHPTLMDSQDFRFSADFPGELCRRMEESYPGAVCLFVNGAAGDERPCDAIGGTPEERIQRFGGLLAEGATALINRVPSHAGGNLAAWGRGYPLPRPQLRLGPVPVPSRIGRLLLPDSSYLHLIALDDLLLVPLSAELTTDLGVELKQELAQRGLQPLLAGYAGGYLGYAVTPQRYDTGSYEASMTWYGPNFGRILLEEWLSLSDLYVEKIHGR